MATTGLVLEGGGMRGGYTAGVLDFFIDKGIEFPYCIGVSAGACNALSYIAKQRKRYYHANTDYLNDKRYMGLGNFFKTGYYLGNRFIFDDITYKLVPLDIDGFEREVKKFVVVTTDCETGKACYNEVKSVKDNDYIIEASSSLPLMSPIVEFEGKKLLDGGIADSIPVEYALNDGCDRAVVVLTQHKGYRKGKNKLIPIIKMRYGKYPKMIEALKNRADCYNKTLDRIEELEKEGKVFVIRPKEPVKVGRMERSVEKITELYETGFKEAEEQYENLMEFLSK